MAKQAKIPQTEWTTGGRDISNTAIPLYQKNLTRMDEYLENPQARMDEYIKKYYGPDAIYNQDFLNTYNRNMANQIGSNYAATGGGYNSSGERAVYDRQKLFNDLASRLQAYGVTSGRQMADQDYTNMVNANTSYHNAYNLGKNYSDVEQHNSIVDQMNKNWFSNALSAAGNFATAIAPYTGPAAPFVAAGGALASGAGAATGVDGSASLAAIHGGKPSDWNVSNNAYTNLANQLGQYDWTKVFNRSATPLADKIGFVAPQRYTTTTMANNSVGDNSGQFSLKPTKKNYFGFNN